MSPIEERRESEVLRLLSRRFEEEGYTFLIHPTRELVPTFLKDYHPDAIAISPEGSNERLNRC